MYLRHILLVLVISILSTFLSVFFFFFFYLDAKLDRNALPKTNSIFDEKMFFIYKYSFIAKAWDISLCETVCLLRRPIGSVIVH